MLARDAGDAVALNNSALCRMYACGLGEAINVRRPLVASLSSRPMRTSQFVWCCLQCQPAILLLRPFCLSPQNFDPSSSHNTVCVLHLDMLTNHMHAQSGMDEPPCGVLPATLLANPSAIGSQAY